VTERERVLAAMGAGRPDVVPWFGDLDYWVSSMRHANTLPPEYAGPEGYQRLHRDLGVGFYLQGDFPWTGATPGQTIEEARNGNVLRKTWRTPAGVLTEEQEWLPSTYSWAARKHLVEEPADIAPFLWHIEHTEVTADYGATLRRRDLVGDNGITLSYLPRSPFMDLVTGICGLERLVFLLADHEEEMRALLAAMERLAGRCAEIAVSSPAECLMIPENLSSEMIGDRYYREWLQPFEARWIARIRAAGKRSFIHMDGTLRGLLRAVAGTGFDVLEALTPVPSGDMTWQEVSAAVPPGTTAWGGLPGIVFTPLVSDADFERHVIETLTVMKTRPGSVLGVADQVPPNGTGERVRRVRELVERHGRLS
jgi:hypothetical protein